MTEMIDRASLVKRPVRRRVLVMTISMLLISRLYRLFSKRR